jgi:hypothetical protein
LVPVGLTVRAVAGEQEAHGFQGGAHSSRRRRQAPGQPKLFDGLRFVMGSLIGKHGAQELPCVCSLVLHRICADAAPLVSCISTNPQGRIMLCKTYQYEREHARHIRIMAPERCFVIAFDTRLWMAAIVMAARSIADHGQADGGGAHQAGWR